MGMLKKDLIEFAKRFKTGDKVSINMEIVFRTNSISSVGHAVEDNDLYKIFSVTDNIVILETVNAKKTNYKIALTLYDFYKSINIPNKEIRLVDFRLF